MSALHARGRRDPLPWQIMKLALVPHDRAILHARIEQRLAAMLADGFEDEVRALQARGDLSPELPSMRAVGYRQMWSALAGEEDMSSVPNRILVATRRYARRQLTWLRAERDMLFYEFDDNRLQERLHRQLDAWLDLRAH